MCSERRDTSDIEITPEMIETGARVLRDVFDAGGTSADQTGREIFEVMISAASLDDAKS